MPVTTRSKRRYSAPKSKPTGAKKPRKAPVKGRKTARKTASKALPRVLGATAAAQTKAELCASLTKDEMLDSLSKMNKKALCDALTKTGVQKVAEPFALPIKNNFTDYGVTPKELLYAALGDKNNIHRTVNDFRDYETEKKLVERSGKAPLRCATYLDFSKVKGKVDLTTIKSVSLKCLPPGRMSRTKFFAAASQVKPAQLGTELKQYYDMYEHFQAQQR